MFTNSQGIANKSLSQNFCGTGFPAGQTRREAGFGIGSKLPRSVKAAALAVSLALSALLTAIALRSPDHHWLACISFLLLFVAIRWLGCPVPSRGGGRNRPARRPWHSGPSPTLREGGAPAAALQDQVHSYGLSNRFTLRQSPLTDSQTEAPHRHWFAPLLGYVSLAFLVACANASLVDILSAARLSFPTYRSLAGSPIAVESFPSQVVRATQPWTLRQAYPRAPPIHVAAVS